MNKNGEEKKTKKTVFGRLQRQHRGGEAVVMYDCMGEAVIKQYFWGPLSICCMSTRFITDKNKKRSATTKRMGALPTNKDLLDFYRHCIILFSPCGLDAVFLTAFVSRRFNVARNCSSGQFSSFGSF